MIWHSRLRILLSSGFYSHQWSRNQRLTPYVHPCPSHWLFTMHSATAVYLVISSYWNTYKTCVIRATRGFNSSWFLGLLSLLNFGPRSDKVLIFLWAHFHIGMCGDGCSKMKFKINGPVLYTAHGIDSGLQWAELICTVRETQKCFRSGAAGTKCQNIGSFSNHAQV